MIDYSLLLLICIVSFGVSYLLTPLMRKIALKTKILSKPDKRTVHSRPIPYLGGVAIYFGFAIAILVVFYISPLLLVEFSEKIKGLLIGGTLVVTLGLWDDIKNIRALPKLLGQAVVALVLFSYKFRVEVITNPFGGQIHIPFFWSVLITVVWIVGVINALNLIDGLDGLASGITFIGSVVLLSIALFLGNYFTVYLLAALAGSALGFLRFNFHPAKIFMGDAGSMFLGLILASCVLVEFQYKTATAAVLLIPITVLAIPIYDTTIALVRRLLKKTPIFRPDKRHLHHRLLSMGLSHRYTVLFLYFLCVYFGLFAFLFVLIPKEYAFILLILLGMGVFMGIRTIGFIERKMHAMQKMRRKLYA